MRFLLASRSRIRLYLSGRVDGAFTPHSGPVTTGQSAREPHSAQEPS